MNRCMIPPEGDSSVNRLSECSSVRIPENVIFSPAINSPSTINAFKLVGAKIIILVHASSPSSPIVLFIPLNETIIFTGPTFVN